MISIIAAVGKNNVIGNKGALPWHLSADLKRFASLTRRHIVIMGRKTYESIVARLGKPLPERVSIVLTRNPSYKVPPDVFVSPSLDEALKACRTIRPYARDQVAEEVFIIGGETVYKSALPQADKLYLTEVTAEVLGDAFFPEWNKAEWSLAHEESHVKNGQNDYNFRFLEYLRSS